MTRIGARGTPPPPHRRRSIFRDDPPPDSALSDSAVSEAVLPDVPPRAERPRALPGAAEASTTPGPVRPRSGREHRSIFRPEAEHHAGPDR